MLVFSPSGKAYSCWEVVGNDKHVVATWDNDIHFTNNYDKWNERVVFNSVQCSKCKYALLCGGGCAGKLVSEGKDIYLSNCMEFSKIFSLMAQEFVKQIYTDN